MSSVRIEGGGIAGQVLRKELTRRGIASRLVERAVFPRDKVCGGVLQWDTWRYLKERFSLDTPVRTFGRIAHVWRGRHVASYALPSPMVYIARLQLDNTLFQLNGDTHLTVPILPRLNGEAGNGDTHLTVPILPRLNGEAGRGAILIDARGAEAKGEWLGFQGECAAVDELQMHYGRGLCAGIAPTLGDRAHLALVVRRQRFRDLEGLKALLRAETGIEVLGAFKGTGRIRYGYSKAAWAVGDAKMATFPFLGLGMKHAAKSAELMAECIAKGTDYAREHRRRFRRQRWIGALALKLYDSPFQAAIVPFLKDRRLFLALYRWIH